MVAVIALIAAVGSTAGDDSTTPLLSPSSTLTTLAARAVPTIQAVTTSTVASTTTSTVTASSTTANTEVGLVDVVDGDTIVVDLAGEQEEVRLIGIDTPEVGEDFADEATAALKAILGSSAIRLEEDVEKRDQYGRLLAYVWVGSIMANAELLRQGLATLYTVPPNVKYVETLQAAQDEAEAAQSGVWGEPSETPLRIVAVEYDAPGDDSLNLNEEYITFRVLISGTLLGYSVEDQTGHRYRFPDRVFNRGDVVKLHSGEGADTQTDLYWGASGAAIWNNDGDTVKVLDPQDQIVESYNY